MRTSRLLTMFLVTMVAAAVPATSAAAEPARSVARLGVAPAVHIGPTVAPAGRGGLTNPVTSGNWSGYVATGAVNHFTSITTNWVQPAVPCTVAGAVSIWAGLDGWSNGTVEQTGTAVDCRTGSPHYYGWYELYPAASVNYSDVVNPGDNITATVTRSGTSYTFYLYDQQQGWTEQHTVAGGAGLQNANAEAILEAPSAGGVLPLPDFGFTGFHATTMNGAGLAANNPQSINMADPNGGATDTTTAYNSLNNFSVSYGNGGDVTGTPKVVVDSTNYGGGSLWNWTGSGAGYLGLKVRAGTSPAIATLPGGGFEGAYQSASGLLMIFGTNYTFNTKLGMAAGTSPAIAVAADGTYQVAFQNDGNTLWTFTIANGGSPAGYAMMPGTSPSVAALAAGGYETAFQGSSGHLFEVGSQINFDTNLGMLAGTSPSITAMPSVGFEIAFQANTGYLYTQTLQAGGIRQNYLMKAATSPAITALAAGGYEIAFQGSSGHLFEVGNQINFDTNLGMLAGTSPAITAMPSVGFEIAFQANTGQLYTQTLQAGGIPRGVTMVAGTSPAIAQ